MDSRGRWVVSGESGWDFGGAGSSAIWNGIGRGHGRYAGVPDGEKCQCCQLKPTGRFKCLCDCDRSDDQPRRPTVAVLERRK